MEMTFGKHVGWRVVDLPDSYLAWIVKESVGKDPALASVIRCEWEDRGCPPDR